MNKSLPLLAILTTLGLSSCTGITPVESPASGQDPTRSEAKVARETAGSVPLASPARVMAAPTPMASHSPALLRMPSPAPAEENERYGQFQEHGITAVAEQPVSTFGIDVDTASYANARQLLMRGRLPVKDAVRVEEFINTFDYGYAQPDKRSQPFSVTTELAPTPWNPKTHLLMIGLKGYVLAPAEIPPANLVFLIDVSGSMQGADRLDLIKESLQLLVTELRPQDRVSVVVYSGRTAALLEGVPGNEKPRIRQIIDSLYAEGSTAGGQAIQMAYDLAARNFIPKGVNRIILATDGDFNVGVTDVSHLTSLIEEKRKTGVSLSLLGVGRGNINDRLMEKLADAGNGKYDFLDSVREGKRVLVQQMAGTLATIAKDVKLQVEFNPRRVAEYRLIGYENRALKREDFANDKVDAGDLGAGHTVTALYEVALAGSGGERLPALRYQSGKEPEKTARNEEYAHIALRYKLPGQDTSTQVNVPVKDAQRKASGSPRFNLAAGVAAFAQRLRGGTYLNDFGWLDITRLVESAGSIADAPRAELLNLIFTAKDLSSSPAQEKTGQ